MTDTQMLGTDAHVTIALVPCGHCMPASSNAGAPAAWWYGLLRAAASGRERIDPASISPCLTSEAWNCMHSHPKDERGAHRIVVTIVSSEL